MAAVPVGAPPPAKRKKEGPDCLETSPVPPAMVGADWSSLPYDLLRRIADTLLDTNDVDCYMDLRAVCRHWRSTTDDPRSDATDPRFRPRQWIVLDEVFASDTRRLLVNTASGRCLHRELPQLRDHHVVATTLGGFFVLADKSPPHAARVFNPLTGGLISFNAPVPPEGKVAAAVCFGMASPMLTLLCDSSRKHYTAFPDSECFITH
uniref:F-box domain-containing protein n=2 Tax=Triticum urartu TaxID=4572 RepID=A0A8R7PWX8_TRIUA